MLIDEENRRYFKQQEITLFRRKGNRYYSHFSFPYSNNIYIVDDGYPPDDDDEE